MGLANPLFEASYGRLFGPDVSMHEGADAFFTAFYHGFLADPQVAQLFANTDMAQQIQMLKRSLFQLVSYYVSGAPTAELQRIRTAHKHLAIPPALFDLWLEVLLDTIERFDPQADEATRLAWCWALAPGITFMRMTSESLGEA